MTFRLWRRPQVKVGGLYRVGRAEIEVDSIEQVPFAASPMPTSAGPVSTTANASCAGGARGSDFRRHLLYRIAFHVVG